MGQEQSSGRNVLHQQTQNRVPVQQLLGRCTGCSDWGSKDYNTVKVDAKSLRSPAAKENVPNGQVLTYMEERDLSMEVTNEEEERKAWETIATRIAEEQRRVAKQREMEGLFKEEQVRKLAEQQQREAERRRLQLEQQAMEREEKERQLQQLQIQEELERQRQEQELEETIRRQREEARQKKIKEIEDQKKLSAWLRENNFKTVNDLVSKRFAKVMPLHAAVRQNDPEMVELLLAAGADPTKFNGKNETAMELAQKLDSKGSHAAVLQTFAANDQDISQ